MLTPILLHWMQNKKIGFLESISKLNYKNKNKQSYLKPILFKKFPMHA